MFFFGGAYFTILYFLPIYFQTIFNNSPIGSGVKMLALIVPLTFAAIAQGVAMFKVGIVPLFWIVGGALGTVGCGLFYTMDQNTSTGKWIGYQIIVGFTSGLTFQVALSNAQIHAAPEDMSQATAIVNCKSQRCHDPFVRFLTSLAVFVTVGGSFFLSAAQSALNNQLLRTLAVTLPEIDPAVVLATGATQIREAFPPSQVPIVIDAYMVGLRAVFAITIAAYGVATLIGFTGSWKRLRADDLSKAVGGAA